MRASSEAYRQSLELGGRSEEKGRNDDEPAENPSLRRVVEEILYRARNRMSGDRAMVSLAERMVLR